MRRVTGYIQRERTLLLLNHALLSRLMKLIPSIIRQTIDISTNKAARRSKKDKKNRIQLTSFKKACIISNSLQ